MGVTSFVIIVDRKSVFQLLLMVYSNNDSIFHRFRDISTFTVTPGKWRRQLKLQDAADIRFICRLMVDNTLHILVVWELERFERANVSLNVTDNGSIW